MSKVRLCWISKSYNTGTMINWLPEGTPCCAEFDSLEQLQSVMRKCTPNGEWIEDIKGNRLDIEIQYAKDEMK